MIVVYLSWACAIFSLLITFFSIRSKGFMEGGRPVWIFVLLLVPVWFLTRYATMTIDARTASAYAMLIGFLMQPVTGREHSRWFLSDVALALLCVGVVVTHFVHESEEPLLAVDKVGSLVLPYIVGRLFLRSARDIETILPTFCVVIAILGGYSFFEGLVRKNPLELVLGRPWLDKSFENFDEVRWGLKRAYGPQTHSIYLGLTLAMVMPWAIEAALRSWRLQGPWWWRLVPLLDLAGIVSTGSRAAQIALLAVLFATFFQSFPRRRGGALIFIVLAFIGFELARDEIISLLGQYISENKEGEEYVMINGIRYRYSGTLHRDLLFVVYEDAIEKNTWLGYGALDKQKILYVDPKMDDRFKSIDNHYLLWFLQYGYLGITLFALLAVCFLWNLLFPMLFATGPPGRLAGGLFGAIVGTLIAMRSVWFASDYAWVWLFCGGLSTCLSRLRETAEGATPVD